MNVWRMFREFIGDWGFWGFFLFVSATHRILQQTEEALARPGLQGTERAVSSGERKSNRWAQRDHWFGRVSVGIRLEFRGKS